MTRSANLPGAGSSGTALDARPEPWPGSGHSTSGIGKAWLHLPTGAAGLMGIRPHHDGGPIVDRSTRLLDAVNSEPVPAAQPSTSRTAADAETALCALGWRVITRAEAAARLHAAGYRLGTNRAAGHVLYADDAHEISWRTDPTGCCLEAFAAPLDSASSGDDVRAMSRRGAAPPLPLAPVVIPMIVDGGRSLYNRRVTRSAADNP